MFSSVEKFQDIIKEFYNARYAIAVDSCTHGIELCLRLTKPLFVTCPKQTYVSIPMTFKKLELEFTFTDDKWQDKYTIGNTNIVDSAVYFRENSYISGTYMVLSFQYKKHLSLGRGGMILLDDKNDSIVLKKMSYDGRLPDVPWREQNIDTMGYHYYMTPETADLGIEKFIQAKNTVVTRQSYLDYPDVSKFKVFNVK